MKNSKRGNMMTDSKSLRQKHPYGHILPSDHVDQEEYSFRLSANSDASLLHDDHPPPPFSSDNSSPYDQSPPQARPSWDLSSSPPPLSFNQESSPLSKSPWSSHFMWGNNESYTYTGQMGSLVREEGHIYSLAASGDLLYTGSDSKNIRVWKNQKEFTGFKSNSGLVKAIIISGDRIFTGHQDGKIRVWKVSAKDPGVHKRVGTLPTFKACIKSSFKPSHYVENKRHKNAVWIRHLDAISSLSLSEDQSLLYSASWDKTIKVWRVSDSKCLESIDAHDDAVNSVISGFDGLVFTGSADGTVKVWRREMQGKGTKHFFSQTLLKQECAVTALAVDPSATVLYCGSSDGLVNFWERDKLLSHGGVLRGHKLAVLCLATAGNLVLSGSADMNICVWRKEEADHVCLSIQSGHTGPVKCLAVEEDKTAKRGDKQYIVYSGSLDKSVKIWRVSGLAAPMQTPPLPAHQPDNFNMPQTFPSIQSLSSQNGRVMSQRRRF